MMIMGLDLATKVGHCWGRGDDGLPRLGHHDLPKTGADVGWFLCEYRDWLRIRLDRVQPSLVVFEAPVLAKGATIAVTRKLHALPGVTEMECRDRGIPARQCLPSEAKRTLTGRGNAKKFEMVRACRAFGLEPHSYGDGENEASDEADAFAVWLVAVLNQRPDLVGRWSPLFSKGARR